MQRKQQTTFQVIHHRLLTAYLLILVAILVMFALAVRVVFARSLTHQLTSKLTTLGRAAAANTEYEHGHFTIGEDFSAPDLIARRQAIQWFDAQGHLLVQKGVAISHLPLAPQLTVQVEAQPDRIESVTLPLVGSDRQSAVGYVRVSQSLAPVDETLERLDWGLGGGIVLALVFSGISGIWLTRQAMRPIEASFQRLQQFTADASHELRSPLMAIQSNATVALKYAEGMRAADAAKFQAIASAARQLSRLAADLLLLARSEQGIQREQQPLHLSALLTDLVQLHQVQARAKQICFMVEPVSSITVVGNAGQLTQLFSNLIDNAINYTPAGGRVTVTAQHTRHTVTVAVQDTGIGIASADLAHVFERFWRADQARTQWEGGAGLGLAIAQRVAQNHGGAITVSSQVGIGSCFTVQLPVAAINKDP